MKLAVFGRKDTIQKVVDCLSCEGLEVTSIPKGDDNILVLRHLAEFDLVIVDNLAKGAESTCRCIADLPHVRLVLIVRGTQADWNKLRSIDPFGYIPEGAGMIELAARLKAILRRIQPAGSTEEISLTCLLEEEQNTS